MKKFPSIDQFRQVIREVKSHHDFSGKDENGDTVYKHSTPYPKIKFSGTVKLHGTNAAIVRYKNLTEESLEIRTEFQSRERVLSLTQDNAGFMLSMMAKDLEFLFRDTEYKDYVAVFGEWCGSSIQKGVAISQCPKMFVIFGVMIDDVWIEYYRKDNDQQIYNINQFQKYEMEIDFEQPELSQNQLIEITNAVEKQCPVGKHFGFEGVGEGVVWKGNHNNNFYIFKVKGEEHSVSKVKTLASVDVEMVNSINEFIENTVTENRLKQGLQYMKENGIELSAKSTGDFLRWVVNDVIKEETDTIVKNQLDPKKINSAVSTKARLWYFNNF
jgi:hypothetical protein